MFRLAIGCAALLLAVAAWSGVRAAPIHKWVDAQGVTHYSDTVPTHIETGVTQLDISTGDTARTALRVRPDHYYSIANQWQRMNQERLRRQQLELQRAALSVERNRIVQAADNYVEPSTTRYVVAYPYPYKYRYRQRVTHHRQPAIRHTRSSGLGAFPAPD